MNFPNRADVQSYMKTLPVLAVGLITSAATLVPLHDAEAKHERHRESHYDRHHDRHRESYRAPRYRYHRPSSGVIFSFNFSPTPRYVVPVRSYDTYSRSTVADVQAALARRGYDVGYIDGVAGPRTRDAIADFQRDRGLRVTGGINDATLRALGL